MQGKTQYSFTRTERVRVLAINLTNERALDKADILAEERNEAVQELDSSTRYFTEERRDLEQRLKDQETKLQEQQSTISTHEENLGSLQKSVDDLIAKRSEAENELLKMTDDRDTRIAQLVSELQTERELHEKNKQDIVLMRKNMCTKDDEIRSLQEEAVVLQSDLDKSLQSCERLNREMQGSGGHIQSLLKEIDRKDHDIMEANTRAIHLERQVSEIQHLLGVINSATTNLLSEEDYRELRSSETAPIRELERLSTSSSVVSNRPQKSTSKPLHCTRQGSASSRQSTMLRKSLGIRKSFMNPAADLAKFLDTRKRAEYPDVADIIDGSQKSLFIKDGQGFLIPTTSVLQTDARISKSNSQERNEEQNYIKEYSNSDPDEASEAEDSVSS